MFTGLLEGMALGSRVFWTLIDEIGTTTGAGKKDAQSRNDCYEGVEQDLECKMVYQAMRSALRTSG